MTRGPDPSAGSHLAPAKKEHRGVTFVIPVLNGDRWLQQVLDAIQAQDHDGPREVLVVDDGSTDRSREIARATAGTRVISGEGRGAAAAINLGVKNASHSVIAQVDQDVVIHSSWLELLLRELQDPAVAGVQGYYQAHSQAPILERLAGYGLALRYERIEEDSLDQVCSGNSVYRREALEKVGFFDESLGYGYDNDLSYRLIDAGYRLAFQRQAKSTHHWRRSLLAYVRQQFGQGYGRLDIVLRHPKRIRGDKVSGPGMMARVPATAVAALAGFSSLVLGLEGGPFEGPALLSAALVLVLFGTACLEGLRAARHFGDPKALLLAPLYLLRDLSWLAAVIAWCCRRLLRRPSLPRHSMRARHKP